MSVSTIVISPKYCSTALAYGQRSRFVLKKCQARAILQNFFWGGGNQCSKNFISVILQFSQKLWNNRYCCVSTSQSAEAIKMCLNSHLTRFGCGSEGHVMEIFERKYCTAKTNFVTFYRARQVCNSMILYCYMFMSHDKIAK